MAAPLAAAGLFKDVFGGSSASGVGGYDTNTAGKGRFGAQSFNFGTPGGLNPNLMAGLGIAAITALIGIYLLRKRK